MLCFFNLIQMCSVEIFPNSGKFHYRSKSSLEIGRIPSLALYSSATFCASAKTSFIGLRFCLSLRSKATLCIAFANLFLNSGSLCKVLSNLSIASKSSLGTIDTFNFFALALSHGYVIIRPLVHSEASNEVIFFLGNITRPLMMFKSFFFQILLNILISLMVICSRINFFKLPSTQIEVYHSLFSFVHNGSTLSSRT